MPKRTTAKLPLYLLKLKGKTSPKWREKQASNEGKKTKGKNKPQKKGKTNPQINEKTRQMKEITCHR